MSVSSVQPDCVPLADLALRPVSIIFRQRLGVYSVWGEDHFGLIVGCEPPNARESGPKTFDCNGVYQASVVSYCSADQSLIAGRTYLPACRSCIGELRSLHAEMSRCSAVDDKLAIGCRLAPFHLHSVRLARLLNRQEANRGFLTPLVVAFASMTLLSLVS